MDKFYQYLSVPLFVKHALQEIEVFSTHKKTSEEITSGQMSSLDATFHTSRKGKNTILLLPFPNTVIQSLGNKTTFSTSGCKASRIITLSQRPM